MILCADVKKKLLYDLRGGCAWWERFFPIFRAAEAGLITKARKVFRAAAPLKRDVYLKVLRLLHQLLSTTKARIPRRVICLARRRLLVDFEVSAQNMNEPSSLMPYNLKNPFPKWPIYQKSAN